MINGMTEYERGAMAVRLNWNIKKLQEAIPEIVEYTGQVSDYCADRLVEWLRKVIEIASNLPANEMIDSDVILKPEEQTGPDDNFSWIIDSKQFGRGVCTLKLTLFKIQDEGPFLYGGDMENVRKIEYQLFTSWSKPIISKAIDRARGHREEPAVTRALVNEFLVWICHNSQRLPIEKSVERWWKQRDLPAFEENAQGYYAWGVFDD